MLELASMDTFALHVLEWVAWSNVGVAAAFVVSVVALGVCCGMEWFAERRGRQARA